MTSTVDKLEGLSRKINVQIPAEKVGQAFGRVYNQIQKKANIKGFRPGRAPIATVRSIYSEQVKSDVINDLVGEAYAEALTEHNLDPVGYPQIAFAPIEEDKDFHFTAELEVRPEVKLKKFEGLAIKKEELSIPEDRVTSVLDNIREGQAEMMTVFEDRALIEGDVAEIDFNGFVNGEPLAGGSATGHQLEIGTKSFIEGFEEGLLGMKIGEQRTLNLRFPEGYQEPTLSGAPVRFETKLTGIKKKVIPEASDALAAKVGEFKTLDDLKKRIREDIETSENKRIADEMKNKVVQALVEANPVEAPKSLVEKQKEALAEDFKGRMKQQGLSDADFDQYKTKWDQEFTESATFMVKSTFLLDALALQLGLQAKPEEVEAKISAYAKETGIEVDRLKEFYNSEERRSRLHFQVTEEKVVNHLLERATYT